MKIEKIDPKKHINKDGARYHVLYYMGVYDTKAPFHIRGEIRCSEKDCEINATTTNT